VIDRRWIFCFFFPFTHVCLWSFLVGISSACFPSFFLERFPSIERLLKCAFFVSRFRFLSRTSIVYSCRAVCPPPKVPSSLPFQVSLPPVPALSALFSLPFVASACFSFSPLAVPPDPGVPRLLNYPYFLFPWTRVFTRTLSRSSPVVYNSHVSLSFVLAPTAPVSAQIYTAPGNLDITAGRRPVFEPAP